MTISINLLRWSTSWEDVERCLAAVLDSDFKNFSVTYMENPHPTALSLVDEVRLRFGSDARLKLVRNAQNLGYSGGHNRFFAEAETDLVMVLNPDAIIDRQFLQNIIKPFHADPKIGAATGKMIKPPKATEGAIILDGTGIEIFRSRRGRERGQLVRDLGQFDQKREIFGVSGTAAVYRRKSLEAIKLGEREYFDEDFFAYWEDFDLSWRLRLCGFECTYVPEALVEHERAVGVSPGGLLRFSTFVKHHRSFPLAIRQWSWRNHLFSIIKNDFGWALYRDLPFILMRELAIIFFLLITVPKTFSPSLNFFRLLPVMLKKRRMIAQLRTRSSTAVFRGFF